MPARHRRPARPLRPFLALALALAPAMLLPGCGNRTSDRDLELLGVAAAADAASRSRGVLGDERTGAWIDPRTASDWLTERIPGALHMPMGRMRERVDELRDYDVLIVYGRGFKDPIAFAAAKVLADLRVAEVRVLEGGLTAWINDGRPVAAGSPMPGEGVDAAPDG